MFLRVEVYPTAVFARLGGIDYNPLEAFLLALPLLPVAVALLGAERWLFRDRPFDVLGLRYQDRPPIPWRRWGWLASGLVYLVAALIILPIASLFARAAYGGGFAEAPGWIGASLFNSVFCSFVASSLIIGLAIILGHASARRLKGSNCGELITVQAFVVPAVLLGVGLIAIWNRPATGFLYTGFGILILGYMARYAVIGVRTAAMVVAQSPPSLEQAAAVFGGGYGRRLWEIVLPLHRRGLLAAWLLTMLFCLRDLEMAVLYYPPGLEPLTVRIFTLEANGPEPVVAALATIQMLISALMLVVGTLLIKRKPDS
jgi:iron(III) transport system permease protein